MKNLQIQKPSRLSEKPETAGNKCGYGKPPKEHQFKKGNLGRPKDTFSLLTILKRELQKIPPELKGKEKKLYAELLVRKQLHKAIVDGDEGAIKLIYNYVEGMPKQDVKLSGELNIGKTLDSLEK